MIWICTIFLLVVAAWLFFNALNEMRWVEAHSHDETVAADEGLFPSFTARTGTGPVGADGKISIDQEDSPFARAVAKVQETTSKYGDKFIESKVAAARIGNRDSRPESAGEENTLFGRAVARVGQKAREMDHKFDSKMKSTSGYLRKVASDEESLLVRTSRKVAAKSEDVSQRVANRAKSMASGYGDDGSNSDRIDVLGKVSGGMEKVDSKAAPKRAAKAKPDEDLVTRVASKVGSKINQMDK